MAFSRSTKLFSRALGRPQSVLVASFGALIALGTILLFLPYAHAHPEAHSIPVRLVNALFTSTSAVCVTGLVVLDTGKDYNFFGQLVILVLIQLGGLGIMTFGAFVFQLTGRKLSFRSQAVLHDMFYQENVASRFRTNLRWLVIVTFGIEAVGAVLLWASLPGDIAPQDAPYVAIFHAISGFCNAGFTTLSDGMAGMSRQPGFIAVLAILIVSGGLGYGVLLELLRRFGYWARRRPLRTTFSLNTRIVINTSVILIVSGAVLFDLLGFSGRNMSWLERGGHALFQSITARTAGFSTVDIAALPTCSLLWLMVLMFIGGSPGSCAGGIKTTSLAIWVARLKARLHQREDVTIGGRRIPVDLVRRTGLLMGVAAIFNLTGLLILSITEMDPGQAVEMEDIFFEQISAFGTVGLSTGLTPHLSIMGKMWVIISMFVGRLGPLTVALLMLERKPDAVRLPEERLMIG